MNNRRQVVILIFRLLGWLAASLVIIYVWGQNVRNPRVWTVGADWSRPLTANTMGWYPESRVSLQNDLLSIKAEPLYWQLYLPDDYRQLTVSGSIVTSSEPIRLALRQKEGREEWQDIAPANFSVVYDLSQAQVKRNKIELILSLPNLQASSTVILANDWQFTLSR